MMRRRLAYGVLAVLVCHATLAAAEPDNERALNLGHAGLAAFESNDYETALRNFELAERSAHSPVFILYMAKAHFELGELLRARELLRQVKSEELAPDAPAAWQRAQQQAAAELVQIRSKIPSLAVVIHGGDPPFRVRLAGHERSIERGPAQFELDPGIYDCSIRDARGRVVKHELRVEAAERDRRVIFEFGETRVAKKPEAVPDNDIALATLALGLVATGVGVVAGSVALVQTRELRSHCDGNTCPETEKDRAKNASAWADASSVGFMLGILGVGSGLLMWEGEPTGPAAPRAASPGPRLTFFGRF